MQAPITSRVSIRSHFQTERSKLLVFLGGEIGDAQRSCASFWRVRRNAGVSLCCVFLLVYSEVFKDTSTMKREVIRVPVGYMQRLLV